MKYTILTRALALLFLAAAPAAIAQTPALLNYQGRVQTGSPAVDVNGTKNFGFQIIRGDVSPKVQATATARFQGQTIVVDVTNGGSGYVGSGGPLFVQLTGGGGAGALAFATIAANGTISGITVSLQGSGYTSPPTVVIPPPNGPDQILWNTTSVALPVTNGLYSVLLGDTSVNGMNAIPPSVFAWPDLRLRVYFEGSQLSPDQRLAPNSYVSPLPTLTIAPSTTDKSATASLAIAANGGRSWRLRSVSGFGAVPEGKGGAFEILDETAGAARVSVLDNGNVGIGANDPQAGRLVVNGAASRSRGGTTIGYYGRDTYNWGLADNPNYGSAQTSIWASNEVVASGFIAISDARIKSVKGRSNAVDDLLKLRAIEITDYTYIDKIARGNRPQKKVIAQQVEQVFPQAVNRQVDTVPDIYKKAPVDGTWVQLATDLKAGERVKFITPENEESIHEVLEVKEGAFRTAFAPKSREIFVYGREVDDFRTVDYEAIAMLNVSATQELARQLEAEKADTLAKDKEIAALKERLAALEAKDAARDAKLAALAKLMEDLGGEAKAATVSTVARQP